MNNYEFPVLYANKVEEEAKSNISDKLISHKKTVDALERQKKIDHDTADWGKYGAIAGFIPGFIIFWMMNSFAAAIAVVITTTLLGAGSGVFIASMINKYIDSKNNDLASKILIEDTRYENEVKQINELAQEKVDAYTKEFETLAQQMSVNFAESTLAVKVIEWMTNGFSRTIDFADRRSHIDTINVPFSFNVYCDKIVCALGTYDFELNRCANLSNPLEQTALARAIASAIMLNITMEHDKDISGTAFKIDISYSYNSAAMYVNVNITYSAPNGNYRDVEHW